MRSLFLEMVENLQISHLGIKHSLFHMVLFFVDIYFLGSNFFR